MSLILAVALLAQAPGAAGPPPTVTDIARSDLAFARAVEESVAARVPEPYRGLFNRMGDPRWAERDAASKATTELLMARPEDVRWLFRGRRYADPEVRLRCNTILRRLNPCPSCMGSGNSQVWSEYSCWDCGGTRTTWPWSMWD